VPWREETLESKVFRKSYNIVSWKHRIYEFYKSPITVWVGWTCSSDREDMEKINIEFW
jgi:hypothetical protein